MFFKYWHSHFISFLLIKYHPKIRKYISCLLISIHNLRNTATKSPFDVLHPQIEIPELLYCPMLWCRQPWTSKWGCSPTTHMEANANKICPQTLCTMRCFMQVYLCTQITVHRHLTNHGYFYCGTNPNTPNFSPMPG